MAGSTTGKIIKGVAGTALVAGAVKLAADYAEDHTDPNSTVHKVVEKGEKAVGDAVSSIPAVGPAVVKGAEELEEGEKKAIEMLGKLMELIMALLSKLMGGMDWLTDKMDHKAPPTNAERTAESMKKIRDNKAGPTPEMQKLAKDLGFQDYNQAIWAATPAKDGGMEFENSAQMNYVQDHLQALKDSGKINKDPNYGVNEYVKDEVKAGRAKTGAEVAAQLGYVAPVEAPAAEAPNVRNRPAPRAGMMVSSDGVISAPTPHMGTHIDQVYQPGQGMRRSAAYQQSFPGGVPDAVQGAPTEAAPLAPGELPTLQDPMPILDMGKWKEHDHKKEGTEEFTRTNIGVDAAGRRHLISELKVEQAGQVVGVRQKVDGQVTVEGGELPKDKKSTFDTVNGTVGAVVRPRAVDISFH